MCPYPSATSAPVCGPSSPREDIFNGLFRPSGRMDKAGQISEPLSASLCIPTTQPSFLPTTEIILNNKTEPVTLLALHHTWLTFAPGIKSKLMSMAQERLRGLAPTSLLSPVLPHFQPLHSLFPLFVTPILELSMAWSS